MADTIKDRTAIVGIGQTAFGKGLEDSELSLACQAISAALDDAGIAPGEVDGLVAFSMEDGREVEVARNLGLGGITFFGQVGYGGGAGCGTTGHAALAVASGQCEVAVAWRARKRADKGSRPWAQTGNRIDTPWQWSRPWGLLRPVDEVAMLARRYMHEYGATRDHLANVAIAFRKHANRNPLATMYGKPLTREQYMSARWVSEPLCLFDNCLETDGALAAVIVSAERARDLRHRPVYIHSYAQGIPPQHQTMTNYFCDDPLAGPSHTCTKRLWANSDIKPEDVSVAQIYDAFSPLIPLSLEGYGFCKRGEGAAFTEDGALEWPDGRLPTNTSGGGMSEAYVHGFNLIVEGVRQMRGTSTSQVEGATSCLVTSGEGVPTSALLLRR
ncbi:MAG TPA: lipid-transfer protein [Candidatus Binatia bacterium]|nr:lipid-transfer protein [Candidatus Binatia bacterium]